MEGETEAEKKNNYNCPLYKVVSRVWWYFTYIRLVLWAQQVTQQTL